MGIRIRQAPSGKLIEGSVTGQILSWNNTTREWDVAAAPSAGGPPLGGSSEVDFDTGSFVAPAASRATSSLSVAMGGAFDVTTKLLGWATAQLEFQADDTSYSVLLELQASIDGGGSYTTIGSAALNYRTGITLSAQRLELTMIGQLPFSVAPVGDTVLFQILATNDGSSGSGFVLTSSPAAPGNPKISYGMAAA